MGSCCETKSEKFQNDYLYYKSICNITYQGKNSVGFLIKLSKGDEDFFCLIAGENLGEINSEKIILNFDDEKQYREIIIKQNERHIEYLSEINIDVTVIELLPKDNIPINYFLIPNMDYENNINELLYKDIITFKYNNQKILSIKENEFTYSSEGTPSSAGYPIFLKNSSKVIGINKFGTEIKNENYGYLIIPIVNYFKHYYEKEEEEPNNGLPKIVNNLIDFPEHYDYISEKKYFDVNDLPNVRLNQMTINYYIEKNSDKVRLFCGDFVKNNENNCYLLIDGEKHELVNNLILNEDQKSKNVLEIKLIEYKPVTKMSFMFYECTSLISIPDINNWNTKYVTKMNSMFHGCMSLNFLPHLSDWDTTNVTDMSCMFLGCVSLKFIGGIENWNTRNVVKMNSMFGYCRSLISIPDISNWDTRNVKYMNWMFLRCESLRIFPDISKWKLNKDLQNIMMFAGCKKEIIPQKFKN